MLRIFTPKKQTLATPNNLSDGSRDVPERALDNSNFMPKYGGSMMVLSSGAKRHRTNISTFNFTPSKGATFTDQDEGYVTSPNLSPETDTFQDVARITPSKKANANFTGSVIPSTSEETMSPKADAFKISTIQYSTMRIPAIFSDLRRFSVPLSVLFSILCLYLVQAGENELGLWSWLQRLIVAITYGVAYVLGRVGRVFVRGLVDGYNG